MDWQPQQQAGDSIREPPFWAGSTGHPWVLLHCQTRIMMDVLLSSPLISSSLSLSLCVS